MVTVTPLNSVLDRMVSLSRAMDQAFTPTGNATSTTARAWAPAIDAVETEAGYVVSIDLPGVAADKVEVNFEKNTLVVRGERPAPVTEGTTRVFFTEREWGAFERFLRFPQHVEGDKITAAFTNGVLTVTVPKSEAAKPRRIEVR